MAVVAVFIKQCQKTKDERRAQELCGQGGGPGLSLHIPFFPVLSLINNTVSVDVTHRE